MFDSISYNWQTSVGLDATVIPVYLDGGLSFWNAWVFVSRDHPFFGGVVPGVYVGTTEDHRWYFSFGGAPLPTLEAVCAEVERRASMLGQELAECGWLQ
jgi:hypothetical protein